MVPAVKPSLFPSRSLGAREVRALAHPLRLRMLESLNDGPATASMLARELGESSGATSYHLRALAAVGLIVEDFERRKGRERWWTREPSRMGLISSAPAEDPEYDAAVAQLESTMLGRDEDAIRRYIRARGEDEHSDEWRETAFIGGWMVYATREEVDELSEFVVRWLRARRKPEEEREPGTPLVYVTYRALPQTPTADGGGG
jgi:DNA-binding transcriptional ArsR family regulator